MEKHGILVCCMLWSCHTKNYKRPILSGFCGHTSKRTTCSGFGRVVDFAFLGPRCSRRSPPFYLFFVEGPVQFQCLLINRGKTPPPWWILGVFLRLGICGSTSRCHPSSSRFDGLASSLTESLGLVHDRNRIDLDLPVGSLLLCKSKDFSRGFVRGARVFFGETSLSE